MGNPEKAKKLKDYLKKNFDYEIINREPRFSCSVDGMLQFKIVWANEEHCFMTYALHGFADGMTLEEWLYMADDFTYEFWESNHKCKVSSLDSDKLLKDEQ